MLLTWYIDLQALAVAPTVVLVLDSPPISR